MNYQTKILRLTLLIPALLLLSACGAMNAQNPGGKLSPVNAVANQAEDHLMLFGADVVEYFTAGRYVQGLPEYRSEYETVDFYFSSTANKQLFDASPESYLPQYGGYCANGIAFGIPWGGNAQDFIVHEGKLYIFGGELSRKAFLLDLDKNLKLSDMYWQEEINNSNSFWRRGWRLLLRVPHYQTGAEQAEAVAKAEK